MCQPRCTWRVIAFVMKWRSSEVNEEMGRWGVKWSPIIIGNGLFIYQVHITCYGTTTCITVHPPIWSGTQVYDLSFVANITSVCMTSSHRRSLSHPITTKTTISQFPLQFWRACLFDGWMSIEILSRAEGIICHFAIHEWKGLVTLISPKLPSISSGLQILCYRGFNDEVQYIS